MRGIVESDHNLGHMISVRFPGDPFPSNVDNRQIQLTDKENSKHMATKTKDAPSPKELRRQAKNLGVANWEEMDRDELAAAVAAADSNGNGDDGDTPTKAKKSKSSTKAAKGTGKAKKAAAEPDEKPVKAKKSTRATEAPAKAKKGSKGSKKTREAPRPAATEADGPNPFRAGTNLWHITEALMKGGKRSTLVKQLKPKLKFAPRVQSEADFDVDAEIDRRLKVIGYILKKDHGFEYSHEGRGPDAVIKVTPPDA